MVTSLNATTRPLLADSAASVTVSAAEDAREWNAFVEQHPLGTIDHLWEWRTIFQDAFGLESRYLIARRDSTVVGLLPLVLLKSRLFGRQAVSLPMLDYGGLLLNEPQAAESLLNAATDVARRFGAAHVELRHQQRATTLPARQHKVTMRRSLPASAEMLWNGIDRKVRNQVRKAQKANLTAVTGREELLGEFYRVFSENMRDLGTPVYPRRWFEGILRAFPGRARFHIVRLESEPVAAGCVLQFRDTDFVPSASSLRAARHLCPNMLLYWSMLETAVTRGARVFDFGRSSLDAGTYQFKEQWGAEPAPQFWEYVLLRGGALPDHSPSKRGFSLAVECWKRLPVWVATAAGPHIVRHIP